MEWVYAAEKALKEAGEQGEFVLTTQQLFKMIKTKSFIQIRYVFFFFLLRSAPLGSFFDTELPLPMGSLWLPAVGRHRIR